MTGNPVRKTVLYGAAGAILCAVALLVLAFAAAQPGTRWPVDGQGILLWVLAEPAADGIRSTAMGIVSLAAGGNAVVTIPADISAKRGDGRLVELSDYGETDAWTSCCDAVALLLGEPVSGYVVITPDDLAALCDAVGSVELDVAAPVTCGPLGSDGAVEIRRGRQRLSGREVVAYVQGASEEPAAERLERALRGILSAVAAAGGSGGAWLARAESNLSADQLAVVVRTLSDADVPLKVEALPTTVTVRDGIARRVALAVETEKLVATAVRAKTLLTSDDISVAVFNGSGARLAATRAAEYLQARGFRVPRIGNADVFTYAATAIVRLTSEAKAWILRESLPGAAKIMTPAELGSHYDSLRPMIPLGTDLVLIVGAGMEWSQ
jgi:hypothetical protein